MNHSDSQSLSLSTFISQDYKYMYWPDFKYEQLFDLQNDPGELDDIHMSKDPKHVEKLMEMKQRFQQLKQLVKSDDIVTL